MLFAFRQTPVFILLAYQGLKHGRYSSIAVAKLFQLYSLKTSADTNWIERDFFTPQVDTPGADVGVRRPQTAFCGTSRPAFAKKMCGCWDPQVAYLTSSKCDVVATRSTAITPCPTLVHGGLCRAPSGPSRTRLTHQDNPSAHTANIDFNCADALCTDSHHSLVRDGIGHSDFDHQL